ncbi:uncharacterized protein LOC120244310 [Hyaena hyaena]|uniref:uncharacterized protein LOC120244310 n=1 Tax=Hyaena hyaena TaxID=95912 RepID=UPI001920F09D|nr:uncharacterized protein LOC120244310 [Hyaena hyaena]
MKTHHSYSEDPKENRPCLPIREEHIQFNSLPTSSWEEAKKKQTSTLKAVSLETSSPDADLEDADMGRKRRTPMERSSMENGEEKEVRGRRPTSWKKEAVLLGTPDSLGSTIFIFHSPAISRTRVALNEDPVGESLMNSQRGSLFTSKGDEDDPVVWCSGKESMPRESVCVQLGLTRQQDWRFGEDESWLRNVGFTHPPRLANS